MRRHPEGRPEPERRAGPAQLPHDAQSQSAPCEAGIPNVSPIAAPGCYEVPADFTPPTMTEGGFYPGMDDDALKAQALQELGLGD